VAIKGWKSKLRLGIELVALIAFIVVGGTVILSRGLPTSPPDKETLTEARYYDKLSGKRVQCQLCFRKCTIAQGHRGECGARENREGTLYSLVYGQPCAIQIDPVEKEPLLHLLPGTITLCLGTAGCNFKCIFCHNWHMSVRTPEETDNVPLSPEEAVSKAIEYDCSSMSFTYNEPNVFYEYMYDVAKLAQERGLYTYFHTNGALNPEPLRELLKHMDAVCVDLKGFTPEFYKETSNSELEPVLSTLKTIREEGVHLEIVNLVIPTLNDDPKDIEKMCYWIRDNLGDDVPLHFSRFFPTYKLLKLPPTPIETLEKARQIALDAGLKYVTIGNVPGHEANSTFCPQCGQILIKRVHFNVISNHIKEGRCPFCGCQIPGIWEFDDRVTDGGSK